MFLDINEIQRFHKKFIGGPYDFSKKIFFKKHMKSEKI